MFFDKGKTVRMFCPVCGYIQCYSVDGAHEYQCASTRCKASMTVKVHGRDSFV